ncbi:MAG: ABC transporter ATP-binding protein [Desulfurococcaceae archaeon]|nr:ABC transporter ATP-binding protein [Desulfurococcaceae archaeon]
MVLKADNVFGEYVISPQISIKAVNNVSIELKKNEVIGIAGESGCGKSTLIKILYGFLQPPLTASGKVLLNTKGGLDLLSVSEDYKRENIWWKIMSYIPQNSMNVLNPFMKIGDHFVELLRKHLKIEKDEAYRVAEEYVMSMGMRKDVLKAFPHQLSGGMRQRVVVSLALLLKPSIIFADEPTTAVDVVLQKVLLQLLTDKQKELGATLVVVTHDMGVHAMITQKVAVMYAGRVVEEAPTEPLFEDPKHPYTQALINSLPRLGDDRPRIGLSGSPPDLRNPPPGCEFHPRCPYAMDICRREKPLRVKIDKDRYVVCWLYAKR